MGTLAEVTAVAENKDTARRAVQAAYQRLEAVERLMSTYRTDSEISQLNSLSAGESLQVSLATFFVLQQSLDIARRSGGAFDITCRPLIQLWREAAEQHKLPTEQQIQQTLSRIGWQHLRLDPESKTVSVEIDDLQVDLGGIAKGYGLDAAAAAMREAGAVGGLVNVGGDVYAFGKRADGDAWTIGIRNAFQPGLMGQLAITNLAVTTSGIQQRFFDIQGQRYSHIIDPRTGRPAEQAPSVTVIAKTGIDADAWATVFSVLTVEEGKKLAMQLKDVEVLWVWGDVDHPKHVATPDFVEYYAP